jgi:hypothetical protein
LQARQHAKLIGNCIAAKPARVTMAYVALGLGVGTERLCERCFRHEQNANDKHDTTEHQLSLHRNANTFRPAGGYGQQK